MVQVRLMSFIAVIIFAGIVHAQQDPVAVLHKDLDAMVQEFNTTVIPLMATQSGAFQNELGVWHDEFNKAVHDFKKLISNQSLKQEELLNAHTCFNKAIRTCNESILKVRTAHDQKVTELRRAIARYDVSAVAELLPKLALTLEQRQDLREFAVDRQKEAGRNYSYARVAGNIEAGAKVGISALFAGLSGLVFARAKKSSVLGIAGALGLGLSGAWAGWSVYSAWRRIAQARRNVTHAQAVRNLFS